MVPASTRRRALLDTAVVVGVASLVTTTMVGVGLAVERLGTDVRLPAVAVLACAIGVVTAPPVRRAVEQRAARSPAPVVVVAACACISAMLCLLGLTVAVPVGASIAGLHTVLVNGARGRLAASLVAALASSAAALAAQGLGVVDGLLPLDTTAVVGFVLLAFTLPAVANAADVRRQAELAAAALEDERAAHLAALERLALLDPLTGLLTRRGLLGPLSSAAAGASATGCAAVLFVDLDGFKAVNDAHGHAAGDELLAVVAHRLLGCVRPGDAVGRNGGDEFVLVLEHLAGAHEAEAVAERVRREVARAVVLADGTSVAVGASTGVAVVDAPVGVEELVSRADAAMYTAKRAAHRADGDSPR